MNDSIYHYSFVPKGHYAEYVRKCTGNEAFKDWIIMYSRIPDTLVLLVKWGRNY